LAAYKSKAEDFVKHSIDQFTGKPKRDEQGTATGPTISPSILKEN
jgi:hypothetical protein